MVNTFSHFSVTEWVVFVFVLFVTFGVLNGLYNVSRLLKRGSLPIYLWAFNGLVAVLIAASIAEGRF